VAFWGEDPTGRRVKPEETLPGYPGIVIRETDGERVLESMVWGSPLRLKGMKADSKSRPVNNIADVSKPM
jgi:hypothetical protein